MSSELFLSVGSLTRAEADALEHSLRGDLDDRIRVSWHHKRTIVACPPEYADGWHRDARARVQRAADEARKMAADIEESAGTRP